MLNVGEVCPVLIECPESASTIDKTFTVIADGVLLSLFVQELTGTLDVNVYTLTKEGHEKLIDTFPQISSPSVELLIRKQVEVHNQIRVEVITSGPAKYDIRAKGVPSGFSSVVIEGAPSFKVRKSLIGTTNSIIIPADLDDRLGLAVRNGDFDKPLNTLYIAHDTATLDAGDGYPVLPGEALQIDVKAGNVIWGKYDTDTGPVHIIETGG